MGIRVTRFTLHGAMIVVLREIDGHTAEQVWLATEINRRKLYTKRDGSLVKSNQIGARAKNYPKYFRKIPADPSAGSLAKIELIG